MKFFPRLPVFISLKRWIISYSKVTIRFGNNYVLTWARGYILSLRMCLVKREVWRMTLLWAKAEWYGLINHVLRWL